MLMLVVNLRSDVTWDLFLILDPIGGELHKNVLSKLFYLCCLVHLANVNRYRTVYCCFENRNFVMLNCSFFLQRGKKRELYFANL